MGGFQRMAGNPDEKIARHSVQSPKGQQQAFRFLSRQGVFAQMDATGVFGKRHVEAVIHQNAWQTGCSRLLVLRKLRNAL